MFIFRVALKFFTGSTIMQFKLPFSQVIVGDGIPQAAHLKVVGVSTYVVTSGGELLSRSIDGGTTLSMLQNIRLVIFFDVLKYVY